MTKSSTHTWPYDANGSSALCEMPATHGHGPLRTCGAVAVESCARCGKALCPKHLCTYSLGTEYHHKTICDRCYATLHAQHGGKWSLPR